MLFFLSFCILSSELIEDNPFLLFFLLLHTALFSDNLLSYQKIFKLVLLLDLLDLSGNAFYQRTDVLVWSKLSSVSDRYTTQGTFLFALTIVRLNTLRAEAMETRFVNNGVVAKTLANRTSKTFH